MKLIYRIYVVAILHITIVIAITAQIGINTENIPNNTILIVDGIKDNPVTGSIGSLEALNDLTITAMGNVGVGVTNPTTKLHVNTGGTLGAPNPQLIIADGYQKNQRVFRSNADGRGMWVDYVPGAVLGSFDGAGVNIQGDQLVYSNIGATIELEPGSWYVTYTVPVVLSDDASLPYAHKIWVRSILADGVAGVIISSDVDSRMTQIASSAIEVGTTGYITGRFMLTNTSNTTKTYSVGVGQIGSTNLVTLQNVGAAHDANGFYAFRVK